MGPSVFNHRVNLFLGITYVRQYVCVFVCLFVCLFVNHRENLFLGITYVRQYVYIYVCVCVCVFVLSITATPPKIEISNLLQTIHQATSQKLLSQFFEKLFI